MAHNVISLYEVAQSSWWYNCACGRYHLRRQAIWVNLERGLRVYPKRPSREGNHIKRVVWRVTCC